MKDPAFLFYPNDYLGGTMGMTFEEKGAYMELLMLQFNRGHMTSHMIGQTVGQLFGRIEDKFIIDGEGLYYNERLDIEKDKRKAFTDSRKNNITGKNQYTNKSGHMTSHMENENRNIDLLNIVVDKYKIVLPENFDSLILEWLKYKSEKKQSYKEVGLKTFINKFIEDSNSDFKTARAMLDFSMSSNYTGLFKPKEINGHDILGYNETYVQGKRIFNRCIEIPKGTRACPDNLHFWNADKKDWSRC